MGGASALSLFGGFASYELVEVAFFASGGGFLKEQREAALVKFLEEFGPVDVLQ